MKTEEFDNAIRKKLESIDPVFSDSDVDKVMQHVRKSPRFPWKGMNGSWLLYTLSAAAMVGVTTWMVISHGEKSKTLQPPAVETVQKFIPAAPEVAVTDSVVESSKELKEEVKTLHPEAGNANESVKKPVLPKQAVSEKSQTVKTSIVREPTHTIEVKEPIPVVKETVPAKQVTPVPAEEIPMQAAEPMKALQEENAMAVQPENVMEKPALQQEVNPEMPVSRKVNEGVPADKHILKDSSLRTSKSGFHLNLNKINLPPARFRIGIAGTTSTQLLGAGLNGELLLGKHAGVTAGISYNKLSVQHFMDKADLEVHHHRPDFNHEFENHLMGKPHVTDITIESRLVQLPVSLNYYFPLKRNFALDIRLGTSLDLKLNQNLIYDERHDSGRIERRNFSARGAVSPFNNLVLSAGVEKQWKRLVVAAQPYYSQQLKQVFYKPKDFEFGFGLGLYYSFGK